MSDGSSVKLPPPTMVDGLETAAQQAVLEKIAEAARQPIEEIVRRAIVAPFAYNIHTVTTPARRSPARRVDVWFVAHGDWAKLNSKDFLESLIGLGGARSSEPESRSGFLSPEAVAKRGIKLEPKPGQEHGEYFTTATLFDRVEIGATRQILITRGPDSMIIAAKIDPRFNRDPEFPNQWRSIERSPDDPQQVTKGPPQVFTAAGFYGKVTRLTQPEGAVFVEYHVVFEEPEGWFSGANLLRSKLPLLLQDEVRKLRRKLAGPASLK